jgi:hypothetical protein
MTEIRNTNVGGWEKLHIGLVEPSRYGGDNITYEAAAEFLKSCQTIEDWGCGLGWFNRFIPRKKYRGIDGTDAVGVDFVTDLVSYTSHCDGILIRHVLEHNVYWKKILINALASAQKKICIVLFIPIADKTKVLLTNKAGIPDIAISRKDLDDIIGNGWNQNLETFPTMTSYGQETVICLTRIG